MILILNHMSYVPIRYFFEKLNYLAKSAYISWFFGKSNPIISLKREKKEKKS